MSKITKIINRFLHPIDVSSLQSIEPVSRVFGADRGTPIDRYYIEKFLFANSDKIKGNVLEISESTYSRKYSDSNSCKYHVLSLDEVNSEDNIVNGDLTKPETCPNECFDCFVCTQTFNFVYDVKGVHSKCCVRAAIC